MNRKQRSGFGGADTNRIMNDSTLFVRERLARLIAEGEAR
jgi:hypothetical protein